VLSWIGMGGGKGGKAGKDGVIHGMTVHPRVFLVSSPVTKIGFLMNRGVTRGTAQRLPVFLVDPSVQFPQGTMGEGARPSPGPIGVHVDDVVAAVRNAAASVFGQGPGLDGLLLPGHLIVRRGRFAVGSTENLMGYLRAGDALQVEQSLPHAVSVPGVTLGAGVDGSRESISLHAAGFDLQLQAWMGDNTDVA